MVDWIGFCAGALTTAAFVPQVLKTWRSRSAEDLSMGMLIAFATGVLLWIVYGLQRRAAPIVIANVVTLGLTLVLVWLKRDAGRRAGTAPLVRE